MAIYNKNSFDFTGEWGTGLYIHNGTVYDEQDKTNPGIQALLPLLLDLMDPSPELIIEYRCQGYEEPRTWDDPGGVYADVWATGAYLYITHNELTPLDEKPATTTDPEYEGLHTQDQLAAPGKPQRIQLNKQQTDDLEGYYQEELYEHAQQNDTYYDDIQRLAQSITEDPDLFTQ